MLFLVSASLLSPVVSPVECEIFFHSIGSLFASWDYKSWFHGKINVILWFA